MRNLDSVNPELVKPYRYASAGSIIPIVLGMAGIALADGAAPDVPFEENPVALGSTAIIFAAIGMVAIARLRKWGWEAKYFGASILHLSGLCLLFFVPCLCLVLYSRIPSYVGIVVTGGAVLVHFWWCRRFCSVYRSLLRDHSAATLLYQEEADAVYYMQSVDKHFLDKKLQFHQIPQQRYFALFLVLALSLVPVMGATTALIGLLFAHIFLLVGSTPVSLMSAGFCTRAWLVFIHYPKQIQKRTNKRVYVDMSATRFGRVRAAA